MSSEIETYVRAIQTREINPYTKDAGDKIRKRFKVEAVMRSKSYAELQYIYIVFKSGHRAQIACSL